MLFYTSVATFVPIYGCIHITIYLTVVTTCVATHVYISTNGKDMYAFVGAMLCFIVQHKLVYMLPCSVIFPNRVIMTLGSIHKYIGYATNTFLVVALAQRVHI